jgi:predicted nucleic acid-binding protein
VRYYFDTYALIEFLGRREFLRYSAKGFVTSKWNLAELLVIDVREHGESVARRHFRRFLAACEEPMDEDLLQAAVFREGERRRKRSLSFVDALGYVLARRLRLRFLTGDEAFRGLAHVLFVK